MVRKFSKEKEVWTKFAIFYFKSNKLNDGRFLLQRSKQSLEERDHVDIAIKFAQIEFRYVSIATKGRTNVTQVYLWTFSF